MFDRMSWEDDELDRPRTYQALAEEFGYAHRASAWKAIHAALDRVRQRALTEPDDDIECAPLMFDGRGWVGKKDGTR